MMINFHQVADRTIEAGTKLYAEKLLNEYHKSKNETIENIYDIIEGL